MDPSGPASSASSSHLEPVFGDFPYVFGGVGGFFTVIVPRIPSKSVQT
jgi:hypothetical protein